MCSYDCIYLSQMFFKVILPETINKFFGVTRLESHYYDAVLIDEILYLMLRCIFSTAMATFCRSQTTLFMRRKLETIAHRWRVASRSSSRSSREKNTGGDNMALHKVNELGWVAAWVGFIIFLFAIFIPTVNRSLNL